MRREISYATSRSPGLYMCQDRGRSFCAPPLWRNSLCLRSCMRQNLYMGIWPQFHPNYNSKRKHLNFTPLARYVKKNVWFVSKYSWWNCSHMTNMRVAHMTNLWVSPSRPADWRHADAATVRSPWEHRLSERCSQRLGRRARPVKNHSRGGRRQTV